MSAPNIDCGYMQERSNEYPQSIFLDKIIGNRYTLLYSLYNIKVRLKGCTLHGHVGVMIKVRTPLSHYKSSVSKRRRSAT